MSKRLNGEYEVAIEGNEQTLVAKVGEVSRVSIDSMEYTVRPRPGQTNIVDVLYGDQSISAVVKITGNGALDISLQGYMYRLNVSDTAYNKWYSVVRAGNQATVNKVIVKAPMPGLLKSSSLEVGQPVRKGQSMFVLEAMKMENAIKAPASGTIADLQAHVGSAVDKGTILCVIDTATE